MTVVTLPGRHADVLLANVRSNPPAWAARRIVSWDQLAFERRRRFALSRRTRSNASICIDHVVGSCPLTMPA